MHTPSGEKGEAAFKWIVEILRSNNIKFRVTGGLAARVYGSDRPLADIDLDVPEEALPGLGSQLKEYIKFGPGRFKDASWDLELLTLVYEGQEIDLGADRALIFDRKRNVWTELLTDYENSPIHEVLAQKVLVIPKDELIAYKKLLGREVDVLDVAAIS